MSISIELHQNTLCDNSWSMLHLLELVDRPNVGANPDLGNVYWTYETPEESCEDATGLAPHANYWHMKNLVRVPLPGMQRAFYCAARFRTARSTTGSRWPPCSPPATTAASGWRA